MLQVKFVYHMVCLSASCLLQAMQLVPMSASLFLGNLLCLYVRVHALGLAVSWLQAYFTSSYLQSLLATTVLCGLFRNAVQFINATSEMLPS